MKTYSDEITYIFESQMAADTDCQDHRCHLPRSRICESLDHIHEHFQTLEANRMARYTADDNTQATFWLRRSSQNILAMLTVVGYCRRA